MNATVSFPALATQPRAHHPFPWRVFGVLLLAALLGTVTLLPYLATLLGPTLAGRALPLELTLVLSLIQPLVLSAIAIGVGLRLGDSVGLGAPLLRDWLRGDPNAAQRLRALLLPSVVAGVVVATVLLVLEFVVFVPNLSAAARGAEAPSPPAWQGLLASFYGGIDEEILLRLGVMTLFAWIGARLTRSFPAGAGVIWTANLLAAILFGLGHLPAVAALGPLTGLAIARVLVLNGLAGIVYGWLYWRRGLLSAMVAHFATDVVLHGLTPALLAGA
ncbi:MAG TPA: CPBP family intramembrane glutamic endopeptidase [Candidatus Eisenbacteria bacterium]|nr:CPBP family intramembrane glutamic endopeptidase [Candidatus Eisenbacteria bacterium]